MSKILRLAVAAALGSLVAACYSEEKAGGSAHSYVSTDQQLALIVGKGRYHFGPQLLADNKQALERAAKFGRTKEGCYNLGPLAFAVPKHGEASCGPYVVHRLSDDTTQQNVELAGHSLAFQTYEVTCKRDVESCPALVWDRPAARFYVSNDSELLAFELLPTTPDRQFFIRTSQSALQL